MSDDAKTTKTKSPWGRRLLKWTLRFLGGVVVLLILAALLTQTQWFRDQLRNEIVSRVNQTLRGRIDIGKIEGNLVTGLALKDVVVFDSRKHLVARVETLEAGYNLWSLPDGLPLKRGRLDGAVVVVRFYKDGELNLNLISEPSAPKKEEKPSPFTLSLADTQLNRGQVLYIDARPPAKGNAQTPKPQTAQQKTAPPHPAIPKVLGALDAVKASVQPDAFAKQFGPMFKGTSKDVAPKIVGVFDLNVQLHGQINFAGPIDLTVDPVRTNIVLDTTARRFDVESQSLKVRLDKRKLNVEHDRLQLIKGTGYDQLKLAMTLPKAGDKAPFEDINLTLKALHVEGKLVNDVLHQKLLKTDINAALMVKGDPKALSLETSIKATNAGQLTLKGRVTELMPFLNASPEAQKRIDLGYDLNLDIKALRPHNLAVGAPDGLLNASIGIKGKGTDPKRVDSTLMLQIKDSRYTPYRLESANIDVKMAEGKATIEQGIIKSPYLDATIKGHGTLEGAFDVHLMADRTKRHDVKVSVGPQTVSNQKARVDLRASGQLALKAKDPLGKIEQLTLKGGWQFKSFIAEAIKLEAHDGAVDVVLTSPSKKKRKVVYDIDITGKGIDSPQLTASWLDLKSKGELELDVPFERTFSVMRQLMTTTEFKGRGFRGFGITLNAISTKLTLRPTGRSEQLGYTLKGWLKGLRVRQAKLSLEALEYDLGGWLNLDTMTEDPARLLERLKIKGDLKAIGLLVDGQTQVRGARVKVDLEGKPPEMTGTINAQAAKVTAANERLNTVTLKLKLGPNYQYDLDLKADRVTGRPNKINASVQGNLSSDFKRIQIDRLALKLPNKQNWVMENTAINTRGGQLAFDNLNLAKGKQSLKVDGAYKPRGEQSLTAKASNLQIDSLIRDAGLDGLVPDVKGEVQTLDFSLKGTAKEPEIQLMLVVKSFFFKEYGPFELRLKGRYKNKKLTITTLDLNGFGRDMVDGQMRLPVALNLRTKAIKFDWDANLIGSLRLHPLSFEQLKDDIKELRPYQPTGKLEALATISGTLNKPTLDTLIRGNDLGVNGTFGSQQVSFSGLSMESRLDYKPPTQTQGGLAFKGWIDWLATKQEIDQGAKRVHWLVKTPLPFAKWLNDFINKGTLPKVNQDILSKPFEMNLGINQLNLRKIDVRPLLKEADAAGIINVSLTGDGTFLSPSIDFEMGVGLIERDDKDKPKSSRDGLGWNQYRDIVAEGKLSLGSGRFKLERMRVNWDMTDILNVSASFPVNVKDLYAGKLPADLPFRANIDILPVPMRKFQAITYDLAKVPGTLKGGLELSGKLTEPRLMGGLFLQDTKIGQYGKGEIALSLEAFRNVFSVEAAVIKKQRRLLNVVSRARVNLNAVELMEGAKPLEVPPSLRQYSPGNDTQKLNPKDDLLVVLQTYQGNRLPLKDLLPKYLTRDIARRFKGWIQSNIMVRGKWNDLSADGQIELGEGLVYINEWGRTFKDIGMKIALKDNKIALEKLSLKEGPTSISATGNIEHSNFKPGKIKINAKTKRFNLGDFVEQRFFATSSVEVKGDLAASPIATNVHISDLDVILPEALAGGLHSTTLDSDIRVLTPIERSRQVAFFNQLSQELYASERAGALNANIKVQLDKDSKVFHPAYGRVVFGGDIGIKLARGEAALTGGIETVSGEVELFGKKFTVAKGFVSFSGIAPPDPRLQVEAEHILERSLIASIGQPTEGRLPKITIRITGTASNPRLKLLSDPQMSDTDILYILATGRPPDNSEVGQDAGVISAALGAASGLFLGLLQQELKGKIPVQIKLDAGDEGLSDSTIEIGRYINEDIFVSYKHQFGGTDGVSQNIFTVEYHFAPRWMMEAQYSDSNQGQFNVYWDAK